MDIDAEASLLTRLLEDEPRFASEVVTVEQQKEAEMKEENTKRELIRNIRKMFIDYPNLELNLAHDEKLLRKLKRMSLEELKDAKDSLQVQIYFGTDGNFVKQVLILVTSFMEGMFDLPGFKRDCMEDETLKNYLRLCLSPFVGRVPSIAKIAAIMLRHAHEASTRRLIVNTSA
jgi:hypothetical protein